MTETGKKYIITKPEQFTMGVGQNKIPAGYIGRVLLTENKLVVYETVDITPQMCQQTCIIWCMAEATQSPPVQAEQAEQAVQPEQTQPLQENTN